MTSASTDVRRMPRPAPDTDPFRAAAVGIGASLAAVALAVWGAGQVAGRLASGQWPPVALSEALGILVRLRGTLAEPAQAWPAEAQPLLPATAALYTTFAALVAVVAAAAYTATAVRLRRRRQAEPRSAQWATSRQLAPLLVDTPTPGRLTLGTAHGKLVAAETGQSVAVLGPTRSGKTTGLAIPAILEWQGPVIATSVKTDLVRDTITWRESMGEVWVYDPTASTGLPGSTWSPLSACDTWQGAQRVASWMASSVKEAGGGLTDGDFWYASAAKLLAPLLFAAAHDGYTMGDVVRWVDTQEEDEPCDALEHADVPEALNAARASWQREAKQKSSVYTTAETVLAAYADPSVAASARSSQIDPRRLLDGGSRTLYICAPSDEQARLKPLFASLLQSILSVAYKQAHTTGRPLDPSLLIVLDEAANIAPLRDLDTLASTAAGQGVQLVTVWQDLAQMKVRYGERAHTVLNNHRATLVLAGVKDPATLDHTSRLVGDSEITRHTHTVDGQGRRSNTEGTDYRRLAPEHAVRAIPDGEGLLVYGSLPPARLQLRPWFKLGASSREARRKQRVDYAERVGLTG